MRVCVIGSCSLGYMPYLRCYEEVLKETGTEYDIVYWDRLGLNEQRKNAIPYTGVKGTWGVLGLTGYIGFRRFVLDYLAAKSYDLYIVLSGQIAVILGDFLRERRFILDIRDYSHENLLPYRLALTSLLRKASLAPISSLGFLEWLPKGPEYLLSHNLILDDLEKKHSEFPPDRLVASYIGAVKYFDTNTRFIEGASQIDGIEIRYVGKGLCEKDLEAFCRDRSFTNVRFFGQFSSEEKDGYYRETNFSIGCYGNSTIVRYAIPNRLYESCIHRRPIIVNTGTYLAQVVESSRIGIVIDLDHMEGLGKAMREYYDRDFWASYETMCATYLQGVKSEIVGFKDRLALELQR
jgi:hypothetical protein